ncbi:putative bifunctional diguanylate cyclase/phosphodiesterase [Haloglycomyces albus]|uniref:putative bifunctional diguanylate cyclase/phosphodiesterase n=1 Tax=Haloglycomyces albus TaxID=526067 RepID=UPI00046CF050|nr:EAL domain-containing protein [Haloglycomyces albus]
MATTLMRNTAPSDSPGRYYLYLAVVGIGAALGVGVTLLSLDASWAALQPASAAFVVCAVVAVVSEFDPLRWRGIHSTAASLVSISFVLALLATWGLIPALVVQAIAISIVGFRVRSSLLRALFNLSQTTLALIAAAVVWNWLAGGATWLNTPSHILALIASGAVWSVVSYSFVSGALTLRLGGSWLSHWVKWVKGEWKLRSLLIVVAPVIALAATTSVWMVVTVALPLFGLHYLLRVMAQREREAETDSLTGLLNRRGFQSECERKLLDAAETETAVAVVVLDVDRFSEINNALGHGIGDRVLRELAQRFVNENVPGKLLARHGGDEFAFAWSELDGMTDPMECARAVKGALDAPISLGEFSVEVDGSVGVAVYPDDGDGFDTVLQHADIALYEAKRRSSTYTRYTPDFDHPSPERITLLADLRRALESSGTPGVELFYQPQIDLRDGRVVGAEALLRYTHPTRGHVQPSELIAAAEQSSVMRMLTERVVEIALRQMKEWERDGFDLGMAVNVSVRDLQSAEFTDYLTGRVKELGVEAGKLRLEITESALMDDPRRVVGNVEKIADIGVQISLDDFGTGFSSMQHLRRLPVSEIKIDRLFVSNLTEDSDDAAIVSSTIDLAKALDLNVVAEGVEDDSTRDLLRSWGCHIAQGWHFARPMDAVRFDVWLRSYQAHEAESRGLRDVS